MENSYTKWLQLQEEEKELKEKIDEAINAQQAKVMTPFQWNDFMEYPNGEFVPKMMKEYAEYYLTYFKRSSSLKSTTFCTCS